MEASNHPLIYVVVGAAAGQTDVYAWRFGGTRLTRITHDITANSRMGVDEISGTPGGVVFEDSNPSSGGPSVGTIVASKAQRVTITGVSRLYTPTLSNKGKLAFASLRHPESAHPTGTILVRPSLRHGELTTIVREPDHLIASPTWNPAGTELAFALYSTADYRTRSILVIDDQGRQVSTIHDPDLRAGVLSWSPVTPWLGAYGRHQSAFINTRTKVVRALPAGWDFGCWQPNGKTALLINGNQVGLATPAHPSTITSRMRLPGHAIAFGCAYAPGPRS